MTHDDPQIAKDPGETPAQPPAQAGGWALVVLGILCRFIAAGITTKIAPGLREGLQQAFFGGNDNLGWKVAGLNALHELGGVLVIVGAFMVVIVFTVSRIRSR